MKTILASLTEENKADVYEAIIDQLWDKCTDGYKLHQLNEFEKPLIVAQIIGDSINGGGINSYFFNNGNRYTVEGLDAFQKLEMDKVYEIFKKAVDVFPAAQIPNDLESCRQIMEAFPEENEIDDTWNELTNTFYGLDEYILDKKLEYIRKHVDRFEV